MPPFEIWFTTPHTYDGGDPGKPNGGTPAAKIGQATRHFNARLVVPWKGWRTFDFEISPHDTVISSIAAGHMYPYPEPYTTMVYVQWRGFAVFWGVVEDIQAVAGTNRIRFSCKDPGHYLENLYVRWGNFIYGTGFTMDDRMMPPTTKVSLPLDYRGLRRLRDAAYPTIIESRSVDTPALGIRNGENTDADETRTFGVERGQELARCWLDLGMNTLGPDWILVPLHYEDNSSDLNYVKLNTYEVFQEDVSDTVVFQDGIGLNNSKISWNPGGKIVTQAVVVYRQQEVPGIKGRVVRRNRQADDKYGTHIQWDLLDHDVTEEVAKAHGDAILKVYSTVNQQFEVQLYPDNELSGKIQQFNWIEDFTMGDIVTVEKKEGNLHPPPQQVQIREVRLVQENAGIPHQEVSVVPNLNVFEDGNES